MFAARSFSRLAIRATPVCRIAGRSMVTKATTAPRLTNPQTTVSFFKKPTSFLRFYSAAIGRGEVDEELIAKLDSEIGLQEEIKDSDLMPESVETFLDETPFEVIDKPGSEEVELVRRFGDEIIRVEFSISDLNFMQQDLQDEESLYEDESSDDIPENTQSGGAQSKVAKEQGRVQVANEAEQDDELLDDEEAPGTSFPAHLNIVIEKRTGAIKIAALAQDGMIIVQSILYHNNADLLKNKSAENDYQSEGLYAGPLFANLDDELQDIFERYLDERGINTALALFVPDYIEYKEEKEYTKWLENLKNFVAA